MKASQTPIYRALEKLMAWAVPAMAHLPRAVSYEHLGALIIHDIYDSLNAVSIALQSDNVNTKLAAVDTLIARMTSVKTAMRVLTQAKHCGAPVMSRKQEALYLDLLIPIARQATGWRNSLSAKSQRANPRI